MCHGKAKIHVRRSLLHVPFCVRRYFSTLETRRDFPLIVAFRAESASLECIPAMPTVTPPAVGPQPLAANHTWDSIAGVTSRFAEVQDAGGIPAGFPATPVAPRGRPRTRSPRRAADRRRGCARGNWLRPGPVPSRFGRECCGSGT